MIPHKMMLISNTELRKEILKLLKTGRQTCRQRGIKEDELEYVVRAGTIHHFIRSVYNDDQDFFRTCLTESIKLFSEIDKGRIDIRNEFDDRR